MLLKRRQAVIKRIAGLVNRNNPKNVFVRDVRRSYPSCRFLGEGINRRVYSLPCGMVLKIDDCSDDQNAVELRVYRRRKWRPYLPVIYEHLENDFFDVLISQRVHIIERRMPRRYKRQFRFLQHTFDDAWYGNVGWAQEGRRRRLLLADAGLGIYGESN